MLESESRCPSVIQTQWAAIADPYKHTIAGWAGFAVSHFSVHLTQTTAEYGVRALLFCGLVIMTVLSHSLQTFTIEQTLGLVGLRFRHPFG